MRRIDWLKIEQAIRDTLQRVKDGKLKESDALIRIDDILGDETGRGYVFDDFDKDKTIKYIIKIFDPLNNTWVDVTESISFEEADEIYYKVTTNHKNRIRYDDGAYYRIFPADPKKLYTSK